MEIVFLGTGATLPSRVRNVSSTAVILEGGVLLFDCGEGTQRQLILSGVSFMKVNWIVLSHFHGDHVLGIPGLLQSMSLSGRRDELVFHGPEGTAAFIKHMIKGGLIPQSFPISAVEMKGGESRQMGEYKLSCVNATHNTMTLSFRLDGKPRPGRFYPKKAMKLGVKPGPLFGILQKNRQVKVEGRIVRPSEVMGKPRPGPSIGYAIDTRPNRDISSLMKGVDVLIFDSTFSGELKKRAVETGHSTCIEAATIAQRARVGRLYLDHISARYEDTSPLLSEARKKFPRSYVAKDFMRYVVKPK